MRALVPVAFGGTPKTRGRHNLTFPAHQYHVEWRPPRRRVAAADQRRRGAGAIRDLVLEAYALCDATGVDYESLPRNVARRVKP